MVTAESEGVGRVVERARGASRVERAAWSERVERAAWSEPRGASRVERAREASRVKRAAWSERVERAAWSEPRGASRVERAAWSEPRGASRVERAAWSEPLDAEFNTERRLLPPRPDSPTSHASPLHQHHRHNHRHHHYTACDDYYRSDEHSEAVQDALARQRERRSGVPMPSKRDSLVAQMSVDTYTPPDTSSASDDDGSLHCPAVDREDGGGAGGSVGGATPSSASPCSLSVERWISRAVRRSSTSSSSASSSSSHSAGRSADRRSVSSDCTPVRGGAIGRPAADAIHHHRHRHHHLHHHQYQQQQQLHQFHQHHHHQQQQQHWPTGDGARLSVSHGALACLGGPRWADGTGVATGGAGGAEALAPGPLGPGAACSVGALADAVAGRSRVGSYGAPPDVTSGASERHPPGRPPHAKRSHVASVRGLPRRLGNVELMETADGVPVNSRVSAKIQQLVETLKRPKRPPLKEFFVDDSEELLEVHQPDPNQPRPRGPEMRPGRGERLVVGPGGGGGGGGGGDCGECSECGAAGASLEAVLERWGSTASKMPCTTTLDAYGKPLGTLTYGKLWSRSMKVAFALLHKLSGKPDGGLKPGHRVALVYPNSDATAFVTAFYGCLLAQLTPVPVEVPLSRKDSASQQIGFLLGTCGVAVALTSDACHRGLPKGPTGDIVQFKGWPKVQWFVTDSRNLSKPPKDWRPHVHEADDSTAMIEYKTGREGSVVGVTVTRRAALEHCRALRQACAYIEGETMVNVLDFKKDVGLWHGILAGVFCMLHVVCVPYALMKVNPVSWLQKVFAYKATVACVKSRDLHWAMVGFQEQKDVELASLRSLLVADAANPWSLSSCDAFVSTFRCRGLRPEAVQPCAYSAEGLTVAIRRLRQAGMVSVVSRVDGSMLVSGRRHSSDDVVATVLAVEPGKFVFRGRIAVFSITVLHDERIVVVAEQRPDASEDDSFQWMTRVLQAVDGVHQVGVYCLALLPANSLPKTPLGGIHLSEVRQRFLEGTLHPCNVLVCPHTCVTNLPKPRQKQPVDVGPASVMVGSLVAGKRIAQASGRDLGPCDDDPTKKSLYLSEVLQWRAVTTPDHVIFILLNAKGAVASSVSCLQLHRRAERVAVALLERGRVNPGDHVALLYAPGIELIASFYGCLYAGCVPVAVRPPQPQHVATTLPTARMVVEVSKSACILTSQAVVKLLRSKDAGPALDARAWPLIIDTDDLPKRRPTQLYSPCDPDALCYLDYSVSTSGTLAGVKMPHGAVGALCRSIKLQCELYPSREVALCLDPYCGMGFVLWCLSSVYSGHQSILIPPSELELNVSLWLSAVSQYRVRDTFCSYSAMELCTRGLGTQTDALKARGVDLSRVRTCVVVAEERPRATLTLSFSKLFRHLGLHARAVTTAFGCRVSPAVCLQPHRLGKTSEQQSAAGPDPTTVYVDTRALWHDRVRIVERGAPHSVALMESGKILPGVRVIIVSPEHRGPLGDSHLGEIWVSSPHSASGYFSVHGDDARCSEHFGARLSFGDTHTAWARTGYLGFLRRTELTDASGERHDALYVVGALEEAMELKGLRYHPIDIESSILRAHRNIAECAVFEWTDLLVVVLELQGSEQEALDLVALVTATALEEHHLLVGVVVVVDVGVIPINSRGEKQRLHLRDGFFADKLDPIYVAYNM
ncbi:disco-interacting protein 2 homolog C-like [Lethenteron reissneri]|uniref:disco-interacting protein 2 homolog C-like n=2 Tax=Lethenteron reissneri TaxID=7753 RepID=UPI002AB63D9B|nr:disco-interacting protein 2 homolog C-like [Lethenteron reissneri]